MHISWELFCFFIVPNVFALGTAFKFLPLLYPFFEFLNGFELVVLFVEVNDRLSKDDEVLSSALSLKQNFPDLSS